MKNEMAKILTENLQKSLAFTLAEVLITLGIIGIIAESTIPTLVHNTKMKEYQVAYKKAYSEINQVVMMANVNNELTGRTDHIDTIDDISNFKAMEKYFKGATDYTGNISHCWPKPSDETGALWGAPSNGAQCFVDASGKSWALWQEWDAHSYGNILVDTNGLKGPNIFGKDRFYFISYDANGKDGTEESNNPIRFMPENDISASSSDAAARCPHTPCYYKSWILNANNN